MNVHELARLIQRDADWDEMQQVMAAIEECAPLAPMTLIAVCAITLADVALTQPWGDGEEIIDAAAVFAKALLHRDRKSNIRRA